MNEIIRMLEKSGRKATHDFLVVGGELFVTKVTMRFLRGKGEVPAFVVVRWF